MDDDELSELDPEFSQDLESNEEIDAVDDTEETALDPITPSDYLVKNASDYVTIGDYSDVEVTKYTYEITDDMVQEEIQENWRATARKSLQMHLLRMAILYI